MSQSSKAKTVAFLLGAKAVRKSLIYEYINVKLKGRYSEFNRVISQNAALNNFLLVVLVSLVNISIKHPVHTSLKGSVLG